jgi:uncharacterized protein (TIGR03435 family)
MVAITWIMASAVLCGQSPAPTAFRFTGPDESFDVASVKTNRSGSDMWRFDTPPGRVVGTNVTVRDLIQYAYRIFGADADLRITGPDWLKTERFDVDAKTPGPVPQDRAMSMLRRLLAERFGMKVHYEARRYPVFAMVIASTDGRLGPQIKRDSIDCAAYIAALRAAQASHTAPPATAGDRPTCGSRGEPGHLVAGGLTMAELAQQLGNVGRPVVDHTGLGDQRFDYELRWAPMRRSGADTSSPGPSIFTALQEQLGLKLVPQEGSLDVLVVDSIARPSEN